MKISHRNFIDFLYRYLGTGGTFTSIAAYFARGESTVGHIVAETSKAIWETLKETDMHVPTRDQWGATAERFESLWNLPNCIGAIDGKHVRIKKFANTGSTNFNYKSYHSIVLMACCDADGIFTMIETGYAGRNSDGGIFRASAIKHWILNNRLDIPPASPLKYDNSDSPFPYYFVANEAFPLARYMMRPYPQRIFNYKLSRGRKTIECAFGMACEKFAVLNGPIRIRDPKYMNFVIKAVCVLHNYVRKRKGLQYMPTDEFTGSEVDSRVVQPQPQNMTIHINSPATALRSYLANYFLTPLASLPWQWKFCL
ncbi:hypothetical protein B7P43_G16885 [Cryptotermes secundus]|uniref:DDE Tnp4 domain-containing protein n=1 Tax=Cryptotermes secundus TaxID=105785 RepID=A0A2J7QFU3_9NEOP|nr:hypothetical protein B7P43_G16885 [Cryptotermes secundus]